LKLQRGTARAIANGRRWVVLLVIAAAGCATPERPDPFEKVNRGIFAFNEGLDRYALEPVAKAWDFVIPGFVQDGIQNSAQSRHALVVANDILRRTAVVEDVARFSSIRRSGRRLHRRRGGSGSRQRRGFRPDRYRGVLSGPYLVVPILGPHTPRTDSARSSTRRRPPTPT
jgi:phospholipid-binding lipoprotein MlaA